MKLFNFYKRYRKSAMLQAVANEACGFENNRGGFKMNNREAGEQVTAKQGLLLLLAAVLVIVVCKIVLSVDTKTTLMLSGAIGGIICMIWGFKWEDVESKFAEGIKSTAMPIVLLIVLHFVLCDVSLHRYFLGNCFHSGRSTFGCGHGTGNSCRDDCRRHCGWSVFW